MFHWKVKYLDLFSLYYACGKLYIAVVCVRLVCVSYLAVQQLCNAAVGDDDREASI